MAIRYRQVAMPFHEFRVKKSYITFEMLCCFFLPLLTFIRLPLIGTLLGSDVLLLMLIPILIFNPHRFNLQKQAYLGKILLFVGMWIIAAIVSDVRAHSSFIDIIRTQAALWTLAGYFFVFFVLVDGRLDRATAALVGSSFALIIKNILNIDGLGGSFFGIQWKFGTGMSVMILTLIVLKRWLRTRKSQGIFTMLFSLVHLALNARSLFLICFLSGGASVFSFGGLGRYARIGIACLIVIMSILIYPIAEKVYGSAVMSGMFGQETKDKYIMQTQGDLGVLLGGRSEMLISLKAIAEKPLLGFGSYAKDMDLRMQYFQLRELEGENIRWNANFVNRSELIPTHSFLFGAWVNNGILGAWFWIYIFFVVFQGIMAGAFGYKTVSPIFLVPMIAMLWNILFSPFGLTQRIFVPIYVVIACTIIAQNIRSPSRFRENL